MGMLAARLSEVAALLGAGLYTLGVLRLSGELRLLHLSTPTVLSSFAHTDVLMKGVGVIASQAASGVVLAALLMLVGSDPTLDALNRVLTGKRRLGAGNWVAVGALAIALLLGARFWEGAAFMMLMIVVCALLLWRRADLSRGAVLALLGAGMVFVGLFGSYLHPPPLMSSNVELGGEQLEGLLVGKGEKGEWYVATGAPGDYQLQVIGGSTQEAARVTINPADDEGYRTLLFQVTDCWLRPKRCD